MSVVNIHLQAVDGIEWRLAFTAILALQRILGHSDLKVTMRYVHLAPDYMARVRDLSPI